MPFRNDLFPVAASNFEKKKENPNPLMINTDTRAPELRFRAGFSSGYARDIIEGSIRTGTDIRINNSEVFFLLNTFFKKNRMPIKKNTAEIGSSAGRLGIDVTQITPLL